MKRPSSQKGNAISRQLRTGPSASGTGKGKNPVSTPCRAFGHTDGRDKWRACVVCKAMRQAISNNSRYWFYRIILGRPSAESHRQDPAKSRLLCNMHNRIWGQNQWATSPEYRMAKMGRERRRLRLQADVRDKAAINSLLEARPWLRKLL